MFEGESNMSKPIDITIRPKEEKMHKLLMKLEEHTVLWEILWH